MTERLVLALDQGTTSSRAIVVRRRGRIRRHGRRGAARRSSRRPARSSTTRRRSGRPSSTPPARSLADAGRTAAAIAAIGLTNQRETTIVWDRATGRPVANAIVWQSRVTAPRCDALRAAGHERAVPGADRACRSTPTSAGPKIAEILDRGRALRARAERGELAFGTVDAFLIWRLTGGRVHATDVSNASRTLLFDIHRLAWDPELLRDRRRAAGDAPRRAPVVGDARRDRCRGCSGRRSRSRAVPATSRRRRSARPASRPGATKATYGTGAFLLMNTGRQPVASANRLLTTVGWRLGPDEPATYALEGSAFVAGAAVQWLRDGLRAGRDADRDRRPGRHRERHRRGLPRPRVRRARARRTGTPTRGGRSSG